MLIDHNGRGHMAKLETSLDFSLLVYNKSMKASASTQARLIMQLLSSSLVPALLFSQIVFGTPVETRSSEATAVGPTVVIKGSTSGNSDSTTTTPITQVSARLEAKNWSPTAIGQFPGSATESYETVKFRSCTFQTFNEAVTSQARTLSESGSIQIESDASYGPVSVEVQPRFTTSKEVSSFLEQTTRGQNETVETFTG
ncbi:hypothetical protein DXG01_005221 [Tephrocybe rancida]|nr:hypothetical protein DXG01_005221 [Tephrocybe rancida]